jgi:periplasmic protein TonB
MGESLGLRMMSICDIKQVDDQESLIVGSSSGYWGLAKEMKEIHIGLIASLALHSCIVALLIVSARIDYDRSKVIPVNLTFPYSGSGTENGYQGAKVVTQNAGRERSDIEAKRDGTEYQQERPAAAHSYSADRPEQEPVAAVGPQSQEMSADDKRETVMSGEKTMVAHVSGSVGTSQGRSGAGAKEGEVGGKGGSDQTEGVYIDGVLQGGKDFRNIRDAIIKNIRYPERARKMGFEGKVVLSFVVLEDGSTAQIRLVQSSGFRLLDEDAKYVVARTRIVDKKMPYGSSVLLPIVYSLQSLGVQRSSNAR